MESNTKRHRVSRRAVLAGAVSAAAVGSGGCSTRGDGETYDYVIVGAGTAGCVLANRLSADPQTRVLLLEAGNRGFSPLVHVPAAVGRAMSSPNLAWRYPVEPDPTRNDRADRFPCGKTLGGGSAINGMFFSRGQREDFDDWAALGNPGWSFDGLLPLFKRLETSEIGSDAMRGRRGPVSVSRLRSVHPLSPVFVQAAAECGIPATDDYNGERQSGASLVQVSQERGWRDPASRAYLLPAWRRDNLRIVTEAMAHRLTFEGSRCTGVQYSMGERSLVARAGREVIVSCGAIQSPKLLMLSGIGPAEYLQSMGIEVLHHLPGVGENLQEHPDVTLSASVNVQTYNLIALSKLKMAAALAQWATTGRGPATSPYIQAVAFTNVARPDARPDIEIMFGPYAFTTLSARDKAFARGAVNLVISLCRPTARGRVSLHTTDPRDLPRIEIGLLAQEDLPTLVAGCRLGRRILQSDAFKPYVLAERLPGADVRSDEDWVDFLRRATFAGNHLVGTCRMGTDEMAVVSPTLQVHGIANLRVIDASIMPRVTSAHTNAAAFVIGEKGADLLRSQVKSA